jgi:tetratricopeptide (TPR) repeat protein
MSDFIRSSLALAVIAGSVCGPALGKSSKPVDWDKKLEKGYYELSIGNIDKAVEMFQEKVKAHPDSGACHTALGLALKKKNKFQNAKDEFAAATTSDPGYANGFYELGSMQESDKEYADAARSFEKFTELSNDTAKKKAVIERIKFCKEHI